MPWVFGALAAALIGLALALWLAQRRPGRTPPLPQDWPLTARAVFSRDERRTFRHLRQSLPHHLVLAKLPLVRFCQPAASADVRKWYRLLGSAQVGFAVCSPHGRVLLAADLDTGRTLSERAQRALEIKQKALAACEIPYERWTSDRVPSAAVLQQRLPPAASGEGPESVLHAEAVPALGPVGATEPRAVAATTLWRDSRGSFAASVDDTDLDAFGAGRAGPRGHPDDIVGIVVDHLPASDARH